jgi:hypothetical protein
MALSIAHLRTGELHRNSRSSRSSVNLPHFGMTAAKSAVSHFAAGDIAATQIVRASVGNRVVRALTAGHSPEAPWIAAGFQFEIMDFSVQLSYPYEPER